MRIIPVLDLMGGLVVQGVQGKRAGYQPVKSVLTDSCAPLDVAQRLWDETDCDTLYIADLDAIEGRGDHKPIVRELSIQIPASLWVDAGVAGEEAVADWMDAGVDRVVVGSETIDSMVSLDAIQATYPAEKLVFSLDLEKGRILSRCPELRALPPLSLLRRLADNGWTHVILLTLDRVGTGGGPDLSLWEQTQHLRPALSLVAGGGVRGVEDLHRLSHLGASGVLVASALHNGKLTGMDLHALTTGPEDRESSPAPHLQSRTRTA